MKWMDYFFTKTGISESGMQKYRRKGRENIYKYFLFKKNTRN